MSSSVSLEYLNTVLPSGTNIGFTSENGMFVLYQNQTGSVSVKGTIVSASSVANNAVSISPANSDMPIGVIYDNGIANGQLVKVVIAGNAEVLLKNGQASTRGFWCGCSDNAGKMYQQAGVPSTSEHSREIGHSLEAKTSGTNVLALISLHFN